MSRLLLGEALLAAGANATAEALANRRRPTGEIRVRHHSEYTADRREALLRGIGDWAGLVLGSATGAMQIAEALDPSPVRRGASVVLSGVVAGAGAVAFLESVRATWGGRRPPSLPYLVLTGLGMLGVALDRGESRVRNGPAGEGRTGSGPRRPQRIVIRVP